MNIDTARVGGAKVGGDALENNEIRPFGEVAIVEPRQKSLSVCCGWKKESFKKPMVSLYIPRGINQVHRSTIQFEVEYTDLSRALQFYE